MTTKGKAVAVRPRMLVDEIYRAVVTRRSFHERAAEILQQAEQR